MMLLKSAPMSTRSWVGGPDPTTPIHGISLFCYWHSRILWLCLKVYHNDVEQFSMYFTEPVQPTPFTKFIALTLADSLYETGSVNCIVHYSKIVFHNMTLFPMNLEALSITRTLKGNQAPTSLWCKISWKLQNTVVRAISWML